MTTLEPADLDEFDLPEPGQTFIPGTALKTIKFVVTCKTTKADIQEQLRMYGLPVKGTKPKLLQSLRDFAGNRDSWLLLFEPQKKRKRGIHNSRTSLSTKRIADQFGGSEDEQVITYKSKKSVARVQRSLDDRDRAAKRAWANSLLSALGVDGLTSDSEAASAAKRRRITTELTDGSSPSQMTKIDAVPEEAIIRRLRCLEHGLLVTQDNLAERVGNLEGNLTAHIHDLVAFLKSDPHHTATSSISSIQSAPSLSITTHPDNLNLAHTAPSRPSLTSHPRSIEASDTHNNDPPQASLDGPDATFVFDTRRVPDPPLINFSNDIDRLFREWESSTLLIVHGRGIPVKHWDQFYKKGVGAKEMAWDALKSKWGKWKFIVTERQRYPDDDSFWRKFCNDKGNRLCYQQILDQIHNERVASAAQDAVDARLFFDGNLDHPSANGAFRYRRSGKSYLLTTDSAISKAWQKLLSTHPDIGAQWDALAAIRRLATTQAADITPSL